MSKFVLSLALALTLFLSVVPFAFAQDLASLTNADVVTMVRAKLPAALMIEKVLTPLTIPDGTPLEVECTYTVSSGEVEEGSAVSFTVVHPVVINGVTVIARGARGDRTSDESEEGWKLGPRGPTRLDDARRESCRRIKGSTRIQQEHEGRQ